MNEKTSWFSRTFSRAKPAPKLENKNIATDLSSGFIALHNALEAGWTSVSYEALSREGYMRNPIVHRCVRLIAESAAALPWLLYEGAKEVDDHPALDIARRPNGFQSHGEFFEMMFGHLLLSGNAFLEYSAIDETTGRANIYSLRPDRVECQTDKLGWPTAYVYQIGAQKRVISTDSDSAVVPVLHLKQFNPLNDQLGFAPLQAALMALDTHNAAATWNKALLDNAARPSGALIYAPGDSSNLTPEQYQQLKDELEVGYAGAGNAGRPMLLEGGLDWKAMGLSPKDMDFIEAKNSASRDIALAFGVPPMLLGIPGDNTYANYQEAHRAFFRLTVLPMVRRVTEAMSAWLEPLYGNSIRYAVDLDQIESLASEREALWARLERASFLSDDEKREAVGYSPLQDGG